MNHDAIIGAGFAGLITACIVPDIPVYESGQRHQSHNALLRFRDESVSHATGVPFRAVRVNKSIWSYGQHFGACNPRFANQYAYKVTGRVAGERSIWNLDPVTRYIAPEDFYDRLCDKLAGRIHWENKVALIRAGNRNKTISTAPMPVMMSICGLTLPDAAMSLAAAPIVVERYRLPVGTNVFQTVYFPDPETRLFRASITGDLLIVESMKDFQSGNEPFESEVDCVRGVDGDTVANETLFDVADAFGMDVEEFAFIDKVDQKYGKITDIPRETREAILYELTRVYNVFSIGRFACWRNILLDDVVKDVDVVKRLMSASGYGRELVLAKR